MAVKALASGAMFADEDGDGRVTVVYLHGWGRDRSDLAALGHRTECRRIFIDLPGFGSSPAPGAATGARGYAERVAEALAEELDETRTGRPLVLVGHSFGGRVALCLAARDRRVSGLLLTGVPLIRTASGAASRRFRAVRMLHRRGLVSDRTMERYRHRFGSADYRAATGVMRDVLVRTVSESYEQELAELRCPVTFVWGELDTAAPLPMARQAFELVDAPKKLVTVAGVGHDVHRDRPDLLTTEIAALCEG